MSKVASAAAAFPMSAGNGAGVGVVADSNDSELEAALLVRGGKKKSKEQRR